MQFVDFHFRFTHCDKKTVCFVCQKQCTNLTGKVAHMKAHLYHKIPRATQKDATPGTSHTCKRIPRTRHVQKQMEENCKEDTEKFEELKHQDTATKDTLKTAHVHEEKREKELQADANPKQSLAVLPARKAVLQAKYGKSRECSSDSQGVSPTRMRSFRRVRTVSKGSDKDRSIAVDLKDMPVHRTARVRQDKKVIKKNDYQVVEMDRSENRDTYIMDTDYFYELFEFQGSKETAKTAKCRLCNKLVMRSYLQKHYKNHNIGCKVFDESRFR